MPLNQRSSETSRQNFLVCFGDLRVMSGLPVFARPNLPERDLLKIVAYNIPSREWLSPPWGLGDQGRAIAIGKNHNRPNSRRFCNFNSKSSTS
ncbi:conserved protein of unknown function [Limnospira indica PCC 8005]|uniref:Uncharacterized protein n=1 Tax=Limnospira indica PCC 8005 TaxID=376219 RepID=A0A9P1P0B1_9CYAN|nr:conserved protein of unknown function [Limnospira indica PCC 8005]